MVFHLDFKASMDPVVMPGDVAALCRMLKLAEFPVARMSDGITNVLFKVGSDNAVLVKIFGASTQCLIDRKTEDNVVKSLMENGLVAPLIASFDNGIVYRFIEGSPCAVEDLADDSIWPKIAKRLAQWHSIEPKFESASILDTMTRWLRLIHEIMPNELNKIAQSLDFAEIIDACDRIPNDRVLVHNDLLSANIIKTPSGQVRFIDFEYGGIGSSAFDIANHFAEFAGLECNWDICPSLDFIKKWIKVYSKSRKNTPNNLFDSVCACLPVPHLFWCLWALLQSKLSRINFDYLDYARKRWLRYCQLKSIYSNRLNLEM